MTCGVCIQWIEELSYTLLILVLHLFAELTCHKCFLLYGLLLLLSLLLATQTMIEDVSTLYRIESNNPGRSSRRYRSQINLGKLMIGSNPATLVQHERVSLSTCESKIKPSYEKYGEMSYNMCVVTTVCNIICSCNMKEKLLHWNIILSASPSSSSFHGTFHALHPMPFETLPSLQCCCCYRPCCCYS